MRPLSLFLILFVLAAAACHKTNSSHRSAALYGQWKWVQLNWTFGPGIGTIYPGRDTTVVLQLDTTTSYSILLNGQTRVADNFQLTVKCNALVCDSTIVFNTPDPNTFVLDNFFVLSGNYSLSISKDTLTLVSDELLLTPAGASSVFKFVPYP